MTALTPETKETLERYAQLLAAANDRARLTGPTNPEVIYREHICDALAALPYLESMRTFVDVGTGGGLPGLVWGICRPDIHGVLLDSVEKKTRLVAEMAEALSCENISVVRARSEQYAAEHREAFDLATARALSATAALTEYLSPLVRVGGRILAFKGPSVKEEIIGRGIRWRTLGLSDPTLHAYRMEEKERFFVVWKKIAPCPKRYPRNAGLAAKAPWFESASTEKG